MKFNKLSADIFVGPQITLDEIADLKELGVRSIIVTRPEQEDPAQPSINSIKEAAREAGIVVEQIPVVPGQVTDKALQRYGDLVAGLEKPIFTYCRSGARATVLWAMNGAAQGKPVEEILAATKAAGHDFEALRSSLVAAASRASE